MIVFNKFLYFFLILSSLCYIVNTQEIKCPRNSVNTDPYFLNATMEVDLVSNLQHQQFTVYLSGNVCNSTLSDTQVYTFGYGIVPTCNLGSLYQGIQLTGQLDMYEKNGNNVYSNYEKSVTISKNPSNNYYIMKIFSNSDIQN